MDEAIPAFDPPEYAPQATFPVPRPTSASPPTSPAGRVLDLPPSLPKAYLSAAEEKEQQRQRFEQAQRRTAPGGRNRALTVVGESESEQSQSASSAPPPSAWTNSPKASSTSKFETAAEEKERLRYEMAIERREQHAGEASGSNLSGPSVDEPVSYNALFSTTTQPANTPQTSALDEKEQKRRYHEARDRVASGGGSGSSGVHGLEQTTRQQKSAQSSTPAAYLSAEQEKELMRQRYENATRAVAQGLGPGTAIEAGQEPMAGGSSTRETPLAQEYMSADQEKAMMRKRFEAATQAVNARGQSISPSSSPQPNSFATSSRREYDGSPNMPSIGQMKLQNGTSPSRGSSQPMAQSEDQHFVSAEAEKDMMRRRYEEATSAVNRGGESTPTRGGSSEIHRPLSVMGNGYPSQSASGPSSRAGKSWATQIPPADAPPPPLPTRPPAEYINLLSPVDATDADIPPWAFNDGRSLGASHLGAGPSIHGAFDSNGSQRQ